MSQAHFYSLKFCDSVIQKSFGGKVCSHY